MKKPAFIRTREEWTNEKMMEGLTANQLKEIILWRKKQEMYFGLFVVVMFALFFMGGMWIGFQEADKLLTTEESLLSNALCQEVYNQEFSGILTPAKDGISVFCDTKILRVEKEIK